MPWSPPIVFKKGVNTNMTKVLVGFGWALSNLIRFRDELPEKNGGWARMTDQKVIGSARGMKAWADLDGNPYLAVGTEQRLEVLTMGGLEDITPIIATTNPAPSFNTTIGSPTVTVTDAGLPVAAAVGDWVNINVPVSVGGVVVQGFVRITDLPLANQFSFDWTSPATATVVAGGAVPQYTTTNTSSTVKVTLNDHGQTLDDIWENQVALTIATVVLGAYAEFGILNIIDANNFEIQANTAANASTSAFENGGNAQLLYLIPSGYATATLLAGFGVGLFGAGFYGRGGSGNTYSIIRQWFLDQWGQNLVGNYPKSPIYQWVPPWAPGNVALAINTTNYPSAIDPPQTVNVSFVTMPQQIMMALGCEPSAMGTQDPNLVRWCNVGNNLDWVASATNQAGSFRIPTGSRLVGGVTGPTFGVIWTDVDMYTFNYIGFPLVFGFNRVAGGVGLLAARCITTAGGVIYFASSNEIYRFDGASVTIVPCPVWDTLWKNLNRIQIDKCHMATNSWFAELSLFYPSADSDEVDSYIRYCWREQAWDYGSLVRLCWVDENVFGPPIGVDGNALIQQHEISTDADGQQMGEYIQSGYWPVDQNGWLFTTITQLIQNFKMFESVDGQTAKLQLYILTINYPVEANNTPNTPGGPVQYGPFTETPSQPQFDTINARGRMVSIRIGGSDVGTFWRLGATRHLYMPDGSA